MLGAVAVVSQTALVVRGPNRYFRHMSATELLKQVKAMPAREREKFLRAVLTLEEKSSAHGGSMRMRMR